METRLWGRRWGACLLGIPGEDGCGHSPRDPGLEPGPRGPPKRSPGVGFTMWISGAAAPALRPGVALLRAEVPASVLVWAWHEALPLPRLSPDLPLREDWSACRAVLITSANTLSPRRVAFGGSGVNSARTWPSHKSPLRI